MVHEPREGPPTVSDPRRPVPSAPTGPGYGWGNYHPYHGPAIPPPTDDQQQRGERDRDRGDNAHLRADLAQRDAAIQSVELPAAELAP